MTESGVLPLDQQSASPRALALTLLWFAACTGADAPEPDGPAGELSEAAIAPEWCAGLPRPEYADLERVDASSGWFEVYAVGEGVFAIYEPMQWQEVISYLVLGTERAVLFDTGMGIAPISAVVEELTALPVTVVNSHSHMDHVGGNAEFERVIGMDTDFTRERSRGLGNAAVRGEVAREAMCAPLPSGVSADTYAGRPWTITEVAADGHRIDLGGRVLQMLHVPGHTPDAIALLDEEAGYLWTGDSFYGGPIWLFAPETDFDAYVASMARLAALAPRLTRLFPAHNTPVAEPARLGELGRLLDAIRSGSAEGTPSGDRSTVTFDAGNFSILLRSDLLGAGAP